MSDIPWEDGKVFDWYFSDECDMDVVIPLQDDNYLELIDALNTIYLQMVAGDIEVAKETILLLAELLVSASLDEQTLRAVEEKTLLKDFDNNLNTFIQELE